MPIEDENPDALAELCPCSNAPDSPVMPSRLIILETIAHQEPNESPLVVENNSSQALKTSDKPIQRAIIVGQEWAAVGAGWIISPSLITIENREGRFTEVQPTEDEINTADAKIIEVGAVDQENERVVTFALIRPMRAIRLEPSCLQGLRLRCRKDTAKVALTIFPE